MPPGIPVSDSRFGCTANLLAQILATDNDEIHRKIVEYKKNLKNKIVKSKSRLESARI